MNNRLVYWIDGYRVKAYFAAPDYPRIEVGTRLIDRPVMMPQREFGKSIDGHACVTWHSDGEKTTDVFRGCMERGGWYALADRIHESDSLDGLSPGGQAEFLRVISRLDSDPHVRHLGIRALTCQNLERAGLAQAGDIARLTRAELIGTVRGVGPYWADRIAAAIKTAGFKLARRSLTEKYPAVRASGPPSRAVPETPVPPPAATPGP